MEKDGKNDCKLVFICCFYLNRKRTQLKRTMTNFPAAPPLCHTKRGHEFKVTSDSVYLWKRSRLSIMPTAANMTEELRAAILRDRISLALSNSPLNLVSLIQSSIDLHSPSSLYKVVQDTVSVVTAYMTSCDNCSTSFSGFQYLKLSMMLPDVESDEDRLLSLWLSTKFSNSTVPHEASSVSVS